eukprot:4806028-Amphidinium_carterae.2
MTLQAEGVQLLGEKAWRERANHAPHAALDLAPCNHDSDSTQVYDGAATGTEHLLPHGDDVAVALAEAELSLASDNAADNAERTAEHLQPLQRRGVHKVGERVHAQVRADQHSQPHGDDFAVAIAAAEPSRASDDAADNAERAAEHLQPLQRRGAHTVGEHAVTLVREEQQQPKLETPDHGPEQCPATDLAAALAADPFHVRGACEAAATIHGS